MIQREYYPDGTMTWTLTFWVFHRKFTFEYHAATKGPR